ncbi:MAG: D-aminoacylase [Candidatus Colwellbacteria bacterium]|nr:D-aminoacylase [Candidatus Colwellbacteria bacterium]
MAYDILIQSGLVHDGSEKSAFIADVGIKGDDIAAIDDLGGAGAKTIINARGKFVVPGFIDITNHSDTHLSLFHYPGLESLVMQGITTVIGGNCGASLAPLASDTAINAIQKWANPASINRNWTSMGEYFTTVEAMRPALNYGSFVGYGTLRRGIMGDDMRVLSFNEREQMKFLLKEAMREGAFGLSLGLAYGHERISTTEEIIELARVLQETGGIVKIHLRSEGIEILGSINEAIRIGREAGIPIQISHFKAIGKKAWAYVPKALTLIDTARQTGLDISFDVSPYRTTGSLLYLLIPTWARRGGFRELFKNIDDPEERKKIIQSLKSLTLHYEKIFVISADLLTAVGHTIAELAEEMGMPPEEALIETIRGSRGRVRIMSQTLSEKNTVRALLDKNSFLGSDAEGYSIEALKKGVLAHPRSFGAYPHFWHKYVNEKKNISPASAIAKMTSLPAQKIGIEKRGMIVKGNFADVVVFNPMLFRDRATYRNPFQFPSGIEWVIINGKVVVENGNYVGGKAGQVLKMTLK